MFWRKDLQCVHSFLISTVKKVAAPSTPPLEAFHTQGSRPRGPLSEAITKIMNHSTRSHKVPSIHSAGLQRFFKVLDPSRSLRPNFTYPRPQKQNSYYRLPSQFLLGLKPVRKLPKHRRKCSRNWTLSEAAINKKSVLGKSSGLLDSATRSAYS